jgi:hypothetical protein
VHFVDDQNILKANYRSSEAAGRAELGNEVWHSMYGSRILEAEEMSFSLQASPSKFERAF